MNSVSTISNRLKRSIFSHIRRCISDDRKQQNDLFNDEQSRQKEAVGRVEKIEISYEGIPKNEVLVMNKNISTPYDCAKHLGDQLRNKAVVGLLNGETLWHMHKPLPDSCRLNFLHYHSQNPTLVNKTFWRSCSFLLGAVASQAFKDNVKVCLHSFPSPNVKSGSFVYDVQLELDDWKPTTAELKVLSIEMIKFCQQEHPFEYLDVSTDLAFDIFKNNPHKSQQIPNIAEHNSGKVTLFRAGTHIDISKGPMIPNTNQIGRITVANVIKLNTDFPGGPIYRFQGVALPKPLVLNHFAYGILEERAKLLNQARIPGSQIIDNEDNTFAANISS
ncbi:39S ribosomal protein L39, mitochondrial [Diorhabda carinulata]|uniref:39S ribosomal protein L39, mitochondrial n=1 Tax=Diorhabda carinulata TaxID=1163345 RepID=UPI00259FEE13|nr:39S ribosomal protein L39, mitochondrial [Diorhabda carinulata]